MFINCKLATLTLVVTLCGQVHSGGIIGGHEAKPHSRPYMVLLELKMPDDADDKYCGGFLLNEDFVMTAAHCKAESYRVLLGLHSYYDKNGRQDLSVGKTFPHKDYDAKHVKNDIMLLQLSSKAEFNEHVKPIALAAEDNGHLPKLCMVSGWGLTGKNEYLSDILLEVNVTLTNNSHCAGGKLYCSEGQTGPGEGDSGGPLVCEDGKAYGLVSCSKTEPDGLTVYKYTKIPDHKEWIDNIMKHKGKF